MARKNPDWQFTKSQELKYARQLRKVADQSGSIVEAHINAAGQLEDIPSMLLSAELYSQALDPWANMIAASMVSNVAKTNERAFFKDSKEMSRELRHLMDESNISPTIQILQQQQVELIKSLPIQAAQRAQDIATQGTIEGRRADEVSEMLRKTTGVTKSRANLIARTEIAKTNTNIITARASLVGADEYIWRTMGDGLVRPSHREMANKVFRFDSPPMVKGEGRHGPGDFPGCRCYPEVIIKG